MRHRPVLEALSALVVIGAGVMLLARPGSAQEASRYPYDPVCPWGRLSNGKGMLVRCITRAEADELSAAKATPKPTASTAPSTAPSASGSAAPPSEPPPEDASAYTLKSLTVTADEGKLALAEKKLRAAKDKLLECLVEHGGLEKHEGEVHVRFLASARGRAEGVSVHKRTAMSDAAAQCIANVVDRRPVGTPAAPMVGATAVIKFGRVKK
jgi:hypothetical protein